MKSGIKIYKYTVLSVIFLLILFSGLVFLNHLLKRTDVQRYIIKDVCNRLGMDIEAEKMGFDILGLTGLNLQDVKIQFRGTGRSIEAMSLNFRFSKWRLLTGDLIPVSVDIRHPVIRLDETYLMTFMRKKEKGRFDMAPFFKGGFEILEINEGELKVEGPSGINLNNISVRVEQASGTLNHFKISGKGEAGYRGKKSGFNWDGTLAVETADIRESALDVTLKTEETPLEWIPWPKKHVQMKKGVMDCLIDISGSMAKGITIDGKIDTKAVLFTLINKERSKNFEIASLSCPVKALIKDKTIEVTSLKMKNSELDLDLDSTIELRDIENPCFRLRAKGSFMPIGLFSRYFPFQITSPWLEDKLFPLFEQGRVRMDELLLVGRADQFRHISDEKNSSVIRLTVTCESFTLSNMGIQMPVSGVSATVDIRDGNLAVTGLSGLFGQSRVNDASIHVKGITAHPPIFTISVDGDFDIQELLTHRFLEVIPQTARDKIDEYRDLTGRLSAKTVIGYRKDWKAPRILSGDFIFTETLYHKRPLNLPLKFSRISFHFPLEKGGSFEGSGLLEDMPFDVIGSIVIKGGDLQFTRAEISGQADMNRLAGSGIMPGSFPFVFRRSFPVKVTVTGDKGLYRYTGEVDTKNLVMETETMLINGVGRGNRIAFDLIQPGGERLLLDNIEIKVEKSIINLSGEYSLSDKRLNRLRVMGNDLSLQDIEIRAGGKKRSVSGHVGCSLDLTFPEKGINGVQVTGNITGEDISIEKGLFPLSINNLTFHMDLAGEKGFINRWEMKLDGNPLSVKGMLHGWNRVKAELLITSDHMDLTEIVMGSGKFHSGQDNFNTPAIHLNMNASGGVWRKLSYRNLSTELDISDDAISIRQLSADLENGKLSLNGLIERAESGNIDITGRVTLENQPIDKLISDTGFNDMGIKGTLAINASLTVKGPKAGGVIKNLSGKIDDLTITQGLLKHSMVFPRILESLNFPDKFMERPEGMKDEKGFYFHSLQGTGHIDKGVLNTEEFVMKSPAFNAVGSGEENLELKRHNIRLLVQPLGNLDFILGHIPIVGKILVDDNETLFTVGYDVTGTWDKPKMAIVPTENLKGLAGVFKRAILTPIRIIENIGNAAKGGARTAPGNRENNGNKEESAP
jgi:hypothetical protein